MSDSGDAAVGSTERELLDRLGAVVFTTDAEGNWSYLNPAWTEITGFGIEETLGTNFLEYVHPDEKDYTVSLFMAVVEGAADACHHETRYRTRSGTYRWLELRATLLYDDDGQLVGNCGTLVDITSRRAAQDSVADRAELTELMASDESFDDLPFGAVLLDNDLVVRRASSTARKLLGHPLDAGTRFADLLPLFDVRDTRGNPLAPEWGPLATATQIRQRQYAELQWLPWHGDRPLSLQTTVIPSPRRDDPNGEVVMLLQDITELRSAETRLATVAKLGQRALEITTSEGLLIEAVKAVVEVLRTDFAELFVAADGHTLQLRAYAGWQDTVDDTSEVFGALLHLAELARLAGRPVHTRQVAVPQQPDNTGTCSVSVPGPGSQPQVILQTHSMSERTFTPEEVDFLAGVVSVLTAALERRQIEDAAVARSLHDPLTGLANRLLLNDRLDHAIRMARRDKRGLAVLIMDLNRFKDVNDTFGHDVGDEVLCTVATRLVRATRDSDTVARVGGDEFVVVMPGVSDRDDAARLAATLYDVICQDILVGGEPVNTQASIGVTLFADADSTPSDLLKQADVAMYDAKRARTSYFVHDA
jgi:diguanylate cyclase (GGDEF)-like protein/PAS domain S-box-containing protein